MEASGKLQRVGFCDIVTGDESWFLQHDKNRQVWCLPRDEVPKRVGYTSATLKMNLTVLFFWVHTPLSSQICSILETDSTAATSASRDCSHWPKSCIVVELGIRQCRSCILTMPSGIEQLAPNNVS
jgi:hypothetical protein